ncbi:MAG: epoxyqueuosine reductase QueH [Candidatus Wallbacteria bacterium]|nr:epoxyqueuosine reductase QueH [Candidatus Wallbacteria bacterium]
MRKKILVHICCLPCFLHPCEILCRDGFEITGIFFNPNIQPENEFDRRRDEVVRFFSQKGMELVSIDYDKVVFDQTVSGDYPDRCEACFRMRLSESFRRAELLGINLVTTTLISSVHQPRSLITHTGSYLSGLFKASFLSADFRLGYYESRKIAERHGIYLQKYCGCLYSRKTRFRDSGN